MVEETHSSRTKWEAGRRFWIRLVIEGVEGIKKLWRGAVR